MVMKMDMKELMKRAQEMQSTLAKKQQELAAMTYTASSGGGMVTVTVNGKPEVIKIAIDRSIVTPDETSMLEDLVLSAVNEAFRKATKSAQEMMSGMMPAGMGNMFGS